MFSLMHLEACCGSFCLWNSVDDLNKSVGDCFAKFHKIFHASLS